MLKIKKLILFLLKPEKGKYFLYLILFLLFSYLFLCKVFFSLSGFLIIFSFFVLYECCFRYIYKEYYKKGLPEKFPITDRDIPIEEHPYLPWVYKKNYSPPLNKKIYAEGRAGFMLGGLKTNNLRHVNGLDGGREVKIPKPFGMYRILCLGDSTTSNYVKTSDNNLTSWPLILEKKLKKENHKVELNNCGQGAYCINEILIKFLIDTIDAEPDMVILYHAFSNIRGYLTDGFERDFYHFRKTMPPSYPKKVKIASFIPTFGLWTLRYLVGEYLTYFNINEDLMRSINRKSTINREKCPEGLDVFRRNLETLIYVCKGKRIQLVLSTYCYYLHDKIKDSAIHLKFYNILQKENEITRQLAFIHSLPLIEMQKLVPHNEDNFVDEVHPSEKGMEIFAESFYSTIKNTIQDF